MIDLIKKNRQGFRECWDRLIATDKQGKRVDVDEALAKMAEMLAECGARKAKSIFIGNGGSAAIASHMATDLWKNGGVRAITFNDSALLTCISNDHGYKFVFEKSISMFADPADLLIAISSSGRSENILRGVAAAKEKGLRIITFSGFQETNPLRSEGELNIYVPAAHYGYVEVIHHALCHAVIDVIIQRATVTPM